MVPGELVAHGCTAAAAHCPALRPSEPAWRMATRRQLCRAKLTAERWRAKQLASELVRSAAFLLAVLCGVQAKRLAQEWRLMQASQRQMAKGEETELEQPRELSVCSFASLRAACHRMMRHSGLCLDEQTAKRSAALRLEVVRSACRRPSVVSRERPQQSTWAARVREELAQAPMQGGQCLPETPADGVAVGE